MATVELLKAYLKTFFVERKPEKLTDFLASDCSVYGMFGELIIHGGKQDEHAWYAQQYTQFLDYAIEILEEKTLSDDCAVITYSLTHSEITAMYRAAGVSRITAEGRKLYLIQFCAVNEQNKWEEQNQSGLLKINKEKVKLQQEFERLRVALYRIMPLVISVNITQSYYSILNYNKYTTKKAARSGNYEELLVVEASTVPENQREIFVKTFSRENIFREQAAGKRSVELIHQQFGDDGVLRWIKTQSVFVTDALTSELYAITMAQDVMEKQETQMKLQAAVEAAESSNRAKSEFLSRMSHEIRTPMNAIIGMTAIAKENRSDYDQVGECLDKIDMASRFLLTLINDILEMSRIESGRVEIRNDEFCFDYLLESIRVIVEPLARNRKLRYEFLKNVKTDSHYMGEAMRIQQVLVNIITNAIKFTNEGGRVRFSVSIESETDEQTNFRFSIADTGIGISESFMQKMFSPFSQEDSSLSSPFGGSGLGLAISKKLVEAMGGSISVDSLVGIGSTFIVKLPLGRVRHVALPGENIKPVQKEIDLSVLKGCHILMAEDHPLNVMVATKILQKKGIAVVIAENGQVALDKFRAAAPGFYQAILMDIRMPVMDGLSATKEIRSLDRPDAKSIPIIAMTANALDEDRRRTKDAGMNAHLSKPFEPMQLYSMLAEYIQNYSKRK